MRTSSRCLQLTPHLHVLMPESLWTKAGELLPLPPPDVEDVEWVLRRVVKKLAKAFSEVDEAWPENGLELLRAKALQERLALVDKGARRQPRRVARVEGFNLHADTWVHENDRAGLERLCRYGSRGPVALERLSKREDGRYEYRTRKGWALVFTAAELVRRLLALLPPRRVHLTRFHGVFAPNAKLRRCVVRPRALVEHASGGCAKEGSAARRPRLDWATLQRKTFEADVWQCPCGGRRQVVAVVSNRRTAEEVLRNLGRLPPKPVPRTGQSPPQPALAL